MKKYTLIMALLIICIALTNCKERKPVKIIEEKDPMVKILHEKDSIRVFKTDTTEGDD